MATAVIMPRQGQSVESCVISKWYKKKGDRVRAGDLLFSYETDKASFEEEAKADGTLLEVYFEEGDDVPCLTNVCVIGNEGESTVEFNPSAQPDNAAAPADTAKESNGAGAEEIPQAVAASAGLTDGRLKISPRARNLAEKEGVDPRAAVPSGPDGRIVEKDVIALRESGHILTPAARQQLAELPLGQAAEGSGLGGRIRTGDIAGSGAHASGTAEVPERPGSAETAVKAVGPEYEEVRLSNIRKVIAKAMHQSLSSTAQLTLNASFDASDILSYRKKLKESKDELGLENITLNDIILYAVSRVLKNHRELNAHLVDDKMLIFHNVNLGLAVDTDRGLMVPTIFAANLKSLNEISKEAKQLVKLCQAGTISPDLIKGGSFTVTNLGTLGVESFTPVLNPPQTGILGVNAIVQRAREAGGTYEFYPAMGLSLTFDHRAVDGAPAARFLQELKSSLENFSVMLAK